MEFGAFVGSTVSATQTFSSRKMACWHVGRTTTLQGVCLTGKEEWFAGRKQPQKGRVQPSSCIVPGPDDCCLGNSNMGHCRLNLPRGSTPAARCIAFRSLPSRADAIEGHIRYRLTNARHNEIAARIDSLTPSVREISEMIVDGKINKVIAAELGTSEKTVQTHRTRVMKNMQARSVGPLAKMVLKEGPQEG